MKNSKIYVAGHNGLVGSAVVRRLVKLKAPIIITRDSSALDLTIQRDVDKFFNEERPEFVVLAAAKVGGIQANRMFPANFIHENIKIQTNVIENCHKYGVKKLLFLGSSCIYPKKCNQPIMEKYLLTGELEETNKWYSIAKIAGIYQCNAFNKQYKTNFICAMPTNIYGINDNFDKESSHVLPAMLAKFHEAKKNKKPFIELWGSGIARREFLSSDDLAEAILFLLDNFDAGDSIEETLINVGYGVDVTIKSLAQTIRAIIGYKGEIVWNTKMPDGTLQKLLDSSKINDLGWKSSINLVDGIDRTYNWYVKNVYQK